MKLYPKTLPLLRVTMIIIILSYLSITFPIGIVYPPDEFRTSAGNLLADFEELANRIGFYRSLGRSTATLELRKHSSGRHRGSILMDPLLCLTLWCALLEKKEETVIKRIHISATRYYSWIVNECSLNPYEQPLKLKMPLHMSRIKGPF